MAEKRMLTQKIVDSDEFLDLPLSAQALYFHLAMRADDDGFLNNSKRIVRSIGATEDDLALLIANNFLLCFPSSVIAITHWRMHNAIKKDRYSPTQYQEYLAMLDIEPNKPYTRKAVPAPYPSAEPDWNQSGAKVEPEWNQAGTKPEPQNRLGKNRLDKDRLDKDRGGKGSAEGENADPVGSAQPLAPYKMIQSMYNDICKSLPKCTSMSNARKKSIQARMHSGYTMDDFVLLFRKAENSDFLKGKNRRNWSASFDWLIKDSSMAKVLDGNYDNKGGSEYAGDSGNPETRTRVGNYI